MLGRPEKEAAGEFAVPGYGAYQTRDGRWVYLLVLPTRTGRSLRPLATPEADDIELLKLRDCKRQRGRVESAMRDAGAGFIPMLPLERVL